MRLKPAPSAAARREELELLRASLDVARRLYRTLGAALDEAAGAVRRITVVVRSADKKGGA